MKLNTYYSREFRTWVAYATDKNGDQIGKAQYGHSKEHAAFMLGMAYNPKQQTLEPNK